MPSAEWFRFQKPAGEKFVETGIRFHKRTCRSIMQYQVKMNLDPSKRRGYTLTNGFFTHERQARFYVSAEAQTACF